jgi:hypothetical protein
VDGVLRTHNPELDVALPEIFAALRDEGIE